MFVRLRWFLVVAVTGSFVACVNAGAMAQAVPRLSFPAPIEVAATGACPSPYQQAFCATVDLRQYATITEVGVNDTSGLGLSCNNLHPYFIDGMTMVTCQATDGSTMSAPVMVQVTVDVPPPIFQNVPGPISIPATSSQGAVVTFVPPTATDVSGESDAVTCDHLSGIAYPIATTTVTCSTGILRHDSNNTPLTLGSAAIQFTITVTSPSSGSEGGATSSGGSSGTGGNGAGTSAGSSAPATSDTTAPSFVKHANLTVDAVAPGGAPVSYTVMATDPDDGTASLTVSCSPVSGSTFAAGARGLSKTTTVTCHASDKAGNQASSMSFAVTVIGARAQVATIERNVRGSSLSKAAKARLVAPLTVAAKDVAAGKRSAARVKLATFITRAAKAKWIAAASRVIAVLG